MNTPFNENTAIKMPFFVTTFFKTPFIKKKLIKKALTLMVIGAVFMSQNVLANTALLNVENAYATPTFALAKMGAGYFSLRNDSGQDVTIVGLSLSEDVANKAELHETYMQNEMAKMRRLTMPMRIARGESVDFKPRGKHLMIMGLKQPLVKGNSFELTLEFASGKSQTFNIPVKEANDVGPDVKDTGHLHHH